MPRGRRGPHIRGSSSGGGCCSCMRYWTPTEEEVVQERIKADSKRRLVGRFINWPDSFYDRLRVQRVYLFSGIFGVFVLLALLTYGSRVYEPAMYAKHFKTTGCYIAEFSRNFTATCKCSDTGRSRNRPCLKTYPCLKVWVEYTVDVPTGEDGGNLTSLLFDTVPMMQYTKSDLRCTYHPECKIYKDMVHEVLAFEEYLVGQHRRQPFPCLYNPAHPREVVLRREINTRKAELLMLLLAILVTAFGLCILCSCLTCGCQYIWKGTPPLEIKQEALRRLGENQGVPGAVQYSDGQVNLPPGSYPSPPPQYPGPVPQHPPPGAPPPGAYPQYGPYPPFQGPPQGPPQGYYPPAAAGNYPPPQGPYAQGYPPPQGMYPPPGQGAPPPGVYPPPSGGPLQPTDPPAYGEKQPM